MNSHPSEQSQWFSEHIQPHERPLRSYLARALPSMADVDDLMQECYARVLRAKSAGAVRSAKGLLFAIARNAVNDFVRQKMRVSHVEITENVDSLVLERDRGVFETVCHEQELALLHEAINSLPERCRQVLLLRKIKGLSQREIAAHLQITENTVESLVVKGARRVAEFLRARGVPPK
ncbi:MAG TPA: RNA polymerase sigma factor [Opitutus sp.]|nr:RNA polymerase sigma factor [Opitutus sp.]